MAVDAREKAFQKNAGRGFQKARFWTLDDDSRAEKFSGGGAILPGFLHRRVWGIIISLGRRKSHGDPKQKDFKLPVSLNPIFYIKR